MENELEIQLIAAANNILCTALEHGVDTDKIKSEVIKAASRFLISKFNDSINDNRNSKDY